MAAWRDGCCWAEESESLSLSCGLEMLGEVLRLSWSMSLGSLLPSSFTLRLSELSPSPSEGEFGRLISCAGGSGRRRGGHARRLDPPESCHGGGGELPQAKRVSEHLMASIRSCHPWRTSQPWCPSEDHHGPDLKPKASPNFGFKMGFHTPTQSRASGFFSKELTWVLVFLALMRSGSSLSDAAFSRCLLELLRGEAASSLIFCRRRKKKQCSLKGRGRASGARVFGLLKASH